MIGTGTSANNKTLIEPLISAVRKGHAELVEELLKFGADVNATDEDGDTALMTAITIGSKPVFQLLVNHGAEVNAENDKGETALYLAVSQSYAEYERMKSEEDQSKQKHTAKEFSLEGSSLMVYTLLREGAHLHETTSGLNPCTVHLTSEEFKNPNPTVLKLLDAGGSKENLKVIYSVNHLEDCAENCIREHLKKIHPERNLYFTVPKLGLPKRLQSNLLFHTVQQSDLVPSIEEKAKEFLQKIKQIDTKDVQHLISAGMDVNVLDENDMSPLMIASQAGHKGLVEQLIEAKADVNLQNLSGDTALIYASKDLRNKSVVADLKGINHMEKIQECMQVLLQHNAEINIQGKDGDTALMHLGKTASYLVQSIESPFQNRILAAIEQCMFTLIDAGADPNLKNDNGCTALILGANLFNFVRKIIETGANVNWKDKIGNTALNRAAHLGEVECIKTLIEAGAEINSGSPTALLAAASEGHVQCVKLLVQEGADLDIRNKNGLTALMAAELKGYMECVKLLIQEGTDLDIRNEDGMPALVWAVFEGQVENMKLLIQEGADPDKRDKDGLTALMVAAANGQVECLKLLVQVSDLNTSDKKGRTALIWVALNGHVRSVKLLIGAGVDLNIQNEDGYTALMWASGKGHVDCVKLLIRARADLDGQEDVNGRTALMLAAGTGHVKCVKLLIRGGADLDIRDKYDETALMIAERTGAESCFYKLLKARAKVDHSVMTSKLNEKQTESQRNFKDGLGKILN